MFHCLVFLLQFWLRLSLSSAKCDGRTGIFWQTAHRWSMKKKKKITSDIHNPIFLMMDISHLMHGQQNHEYLMIQLSVKSEVSFFFTLFSASTKQGKCTKYVGNWNTCAIIKCSFWKNKFHQFILYKNFIKWWVSSIPFGFTFRLPVQL